MNNIETLRAAVYGYIMEHNTKPAFVLLSSDVAKAIFTEVGQNSQYQSLVKMGDKPNDPMFLDLGTGPIELGQVTGTGRVELVADPYDVLYRRH